jgi:hypothetical protein
MLLLPIFSDYVLEAIEGTLPCFPGDTVDQFLTALGMDQSEYSGEMDFGTATMLELDDEDLTACALLWARAYEEDPSASQWGPAPQWCILWGSDQRWWGDTTFYATEAEAEKEYAAFDAAYSEWLGCEDCGAEVASACTCNDEPVPVTCDIHPGRPHATASLACELLSAENLFDQMEDNAS